jgi:hypothetical protein
MKELQKKKSGPHSDLPLNLPEKSDEAHEILFAFYLTKGKILFYHVLGFRQITPSCLPTFSKAPKTLSNCSSVWVAM